jgi:hypothetical protein
MMRVRDMVNRWSIYVCTFRISCASLASCAWKGLIILVTRTQMESEVRSIVHGRRMVSGSDAAWGKDEWAEAQGTPGQAWQSCGKSSAVPQPTRHFEYSALQHRRRVNRRDDKNPPNDTTDKMRVYEDSFSGQKIYPGKVRIAAPPPTTT